MKTVFHWDNIFLTQEEKASLEWRFVDDLATLFKEDPAEAHVTFERKLPFTLIGSISDESGRELCSFTCDMLNENTTRYNLAGAADAHK